MVAPKSGPAQSLDPASYKPQLTISLNLFQTTTTLIILTLTPTILLNLARPSFRHWVARAGFKARPKNATK